MELPEGLDAAARTPWPPLSGPRGSFGRCGAGVATSHARAELYPRVLRRIQRRWTRLDRSQNEAATVQEALLVCLRPEAFLLHHLLKFGVRPAWQRGRRATFCAPGESPMAPPQSWRCCPPEQWVWGDDRCCWITKGAAGWWVALVADSGSHRVAPQGARPRVADHLCGPFATLCGEPGPSLSRKVYRTLTWLVHLGVGEGSGNPGCL